MFKCFLGNLPFNCDENDAMGFLTDLGLNPRGVKIIRDRDTNESRGFGFAEFDTAEDGNKAIDCAQGQDFMGRKMNISEARPTDRPARPTTGRESVVNQ